ncbi:glycosyltransferase family 10 domain-containing protein [Accumulibacter sp.]|uniref:glycosyltransferase family 10 domain-containing protein n=1 Tax=Accumulibacter sp. TaxID=2053492 RepID=UPI0025EC84DA|nr:glycosyltransferase family 10 [Accumulibacter sp.]MCM8594512.1 glycosyltransferase family 10 [Accumulibacter sp.]MCM8626777.1 glycosyltransferase family 10 [Accumulibacter sp.]MDS4048658.1 glycosyltransferase family 10 [Accumulibacter sp.]
MADTAGVPRRVKMLCNLPTVPLLHQFPHDEPRWGDCEFTFERDARDYDWLLVYDDLPSRPGEAKRTTSEPLACPRAHTLLVTSEPSSVKTYGEDFTRQFGAVLTSHPEWALAHPQRIYSQPALHWFYGVGSGGVLPFDRMLTEPPLNKSRQVSMVYSPKTMRHTLHHHRARFMRWLIDNLPELEAFGRQTPRPLDDKADCLRDYRYHVAVENFIGRHHWTEKLADPFLGLALPFYYGCPNAEDYFPAESFIRIDIRDPAGARAIIRRAIADNEFEKRLPALIEARRRVMFDYNLFAVVARETARLTQPDARVEAGAVILSRRALRKTSPAIALRDAWGKLRGRLLHLPGAFSGR